jgi:hypothetical protein
MKPSTFPSHMESAARRSRARRLPFAGPLYSRDWKFSQSEVVSYSPAQNQTSKEQATRTTYGSRSLVTAGSASHTMDTVIPDLSEHMESLAISPHFHDQGLALRISNASIMPSEQLASIPAESISSDAKGENSTPTGFEADHKTKSRLPRPQDAHNANNEPSVQDSCSEDVPTNKAETALSQDTTSSHALWDHDYQIPASVLPDSSSMHTHQHFNLLMFSHECQREEIQLPTPIDSLLTIWSSELTHMLDSPRLCEERGTVFKLHGEMKMFQRTARAHAHFRPLQGSRETSFDVATNYMSELLNLKWELCLQPEDNEVFEYFYEEELNRVHDMLSLLS